MNATYYIGFDFSIAKPACCVIKEQNNEVTYAFHYFPKNQSAKDIALYRDLSVNAMSRDIENFKWEYSESVVLDIYLAKELARMIVAEVFDPILPEDGVRSYVNIYVATEGLSFASKGQSMLDLASYKGVFLSEVMNVIEAEYIKTFPPTTIKKFAGCSKGKDTKDKDLMLKALLGKEGCETIHPLIKDLNSPEPKLMKKTRLTAGVDDLVDAYWCAELLRQTIKNEQS